MAGIFPSIGKGKPGLEAGLNPTGKETIDELGAGISSIARWVRFGPPGRSGDPRYCRLESLRYMAEPRPM